MKKHFSLLVAIAFSAVLLGGVYFYLKKLDTSYDFAIERAAKLQRDHSEYVDFFGEREPAIPNKDENSKTILGIDSNNNGIRDDVDVWINRSALTKNETLAMRQYAKTKQEWLNVCAKQLAMSKVLVHKKMNSAYNCLTLISDYKRNEKGYAVGMMELILLNNSSRLNCNAFYQGQPSHSEITQDANFSCDFEVQYPENVVSGNEEWKKRNH